MPQFERLVLGYLYLYCQNDRTLAFRAFNSRTLAPRLQSSDDRISKALKMMKSAGLLKRVTRKRRVLWVLPTEDELAGYRAKNK